MTNITQLKEKVSKGCEKRFIAREPYKAVIIGEINCGIITSLGYKGLCEKCQAQLSILDEVEKMIKTEIDFLKSEEKENKGYCYPFAIERLQSLLGEQEAGEK